MRDNFRMYYFNLSLMSSRDWRISHALSHHLYTNTITDLEISMFEPILEYMPKEKSWFVRYISWIYSPLLWVSLYHMTGLQRYIGILMGARKISKEEFIPFTIPFVMFVFCQDLWLVLKMWTFIVAVGSFHFALVGLNAAHHHPAIFHDGDYVR